MQVWLLNWPCGEGYRRNFILFAERGVTSGKEEEERPKWVCLRSISPEPTVKKERDLEAKKKLF